MKVLIHGAVNGSNFGDCLYAQIYNEYIKGLGQNIEPYFWSNRIWGASEHLKSLSDIKTTNKLSDIDLLLYMPGGYFGDAPTAYRRIKLYFRYLKIAESFIKSKKNIIISGVGGEFVESDFLLKKMCSIINHSCLTTVRNERTANFFSDKTTEKIYSLFDPILQIRNMNLPPLPNNVTTIIEECNKTDKKKIFLHVNSKDIRNKEFETRVIPALNNYLSNNKAHVFVGTDYCTSNKIDDLNIYNVINSEKSVVNYNSPLELCSFLRNCDFIITSKLHVGVVSSVMEKSVLSFAIDPTKTKTFYDDIKQSERSVSLYDCTEEQAYYMILKYANVPIKIHEDLLKKSDMNFTLLKDQLILLESKNKEFSN